MRFPLDIYTSSGSRLSSSNIGRQLPQFYRQPPPTVDMKILTLLTCLTTLILSSYLSTVVAQKATIADTIIANALAGISLSPRAPNPFSPHGGSQITSTSPFLTSSMKCWPKSRRSTTKRHHRLLAPSTRLRHQQLSLIPTVCVLLSPPRPA